MSKFKVGDLVRLVSNVAGSRYPIGHIGRVLEEASDRTKYRVGPDREVNWSDEGDLELVSEPPTSKYTTEEYLTFVAETLADMQTLIKAKNADYTNGAGPFANFEVASEFGVDPFQGLMLRISDKMQRVKSYCKQGDLQVKGEGVDDCFKDFIGYSLIALAMLNEKRGKK